MLVEPETPWLDTVGFMIHWPANSVAPCPPSDGNKRASYSINAIGLRFNPIALIVSSVCLQPEAARPVSPVSRVERS